MAQKPTFTDEESRWNALARRDRAAEGAFYYAVKTTGVFCRPGCSSRLPKRENVEFFDTCKEAELAGYRPCKRCKPGAISPRERLVELIVQACRHLEEAETSPTLDQLAAEAGLSSWHFHRLFKEIVGVTPKQYATTQQAQRFRDSLKTERTVTAAIYDAGFNSSSRAYDNARDRLSMTPSAYRKGAVGLTIRYGIAPCFLGWIIVAATDRGICAIEFGDDPETLPAQVQKRFRKAYLEEGGPNFSAVLERVIAFIDEPERGIELPLDIQGTAFQERVWNALRLVPPGSTVSYADIAYRIGSPEAVRAVAQACAANKLAVAVPCHRVVRSDGKLSGYRWGAERKRVLLLRESRTSGGLDARNEETHVRALRAIMVTVERASVKDAVLFAEFEKAADTKEYIFPYSVREHAQKIVGPNFVYLRILDAGKIAGFFILVPESDPESIEFRRVVVSAKGLGIGQSAIKEMEQFCRTELQRTRIWLDVFEDNNRGRYVYEKLGYEKHGESYHEGRRLLLYKKDL